MSGEQYKDISECIQGDPASWTNDLASGLRWRETTSEERRRNGLGKDAVLIELDPSAVDFSATQVTIYVPDTGGLVPLTLDYERTETDVPYHTLDWDLGPSTSVPTFKYYRRTSASGGAHGFAILDDFGGIYAQIDDGSASRWLVRGSHEGASIDTVPLPGANPVPIYDYVLAEPFGGSGPGDVYPPIPLGDPYATVVFGEGRFCGSAGMDQWRIELHAYHAVSNGALQQGGLGIWARLDTAYCNFFQPGMIEGQWMNAVEVAAACEWTMAGCVDAAGHTYGFHGCGRSKNCIREHIWSDVTHAALHVPVAPAKIAHLLYGGVFAPGSCPVPVDDFTAEPGVYGFSTFANGNCSGIGAEPFDGSNCPNGGSTEVFSDCGPGGNSISRPGPSATKAYTEAHEIAHSFNAAHVYGELIMPSDPGCVETFTIMGGQANGQSYDGMVDCKRPEFSVDNIDVVTTCRPNSWCPREGFGP